MSDNMKNENFAAVSNNNAECKEAVCIQTDKIYDSCRDKDCLEDLSVIFTNRSQEIINRAINVKCRKAEVIWVYADVEAVPFNKGFFTIDLKYFFKITLDVFTNIGTPIQVEGLATFDKKVILFGSEGNAKIFSSKYRPDSVDKQLIKKSNMPKAVVEVVDPICLAAKLVEPSKGCCCDDDDSVSGVPEFVCGCFDDDLVAGGNNKRVFVTIGIFTIVKIERNVQLLIPAYDFCIPEKECPSTDNSPCDLFDKIRFPFDEFYPPKKEDFDNGDDLYDYRNHCGCQ